LHTDIDTYIRIFIIGGFNIHIYIIPYIHGLELIFTDWTDTEDIYIYIYTVVLQKAEETSTTEQNRTDSKPQALVSFKKYMPPPLPYRGHIFFE
jgi:hypothetical protein